MFSPLKVFAMILFNQLAVAVLLLSLTLCLQCAGVITLFEWLKRVLTRDTHKHGPVYSASLVVRSAVAIVILHGLVILLWASFYRMRCLPSWELAFYFSAVSYSTVGYGDLILPSNWRLLGPLEAITGVLMSGMSVCVLFALVTRLLDRDTQASLRNSTEQSHA
jgi:voltage-gated potassium channel